MNFAKQLKPLVAAAGGTAPAAARIGVTRRTINLWLTGSIVPSGFTQQAALSLLTLPPREPAVLAATFNHSPKASRVTRAALGAMAALAPRSAAAAPAPAAAGRRRPSLAKSAATHGAD